MTLASMALPAGLVLEQGSEGLLLVGDEKRFGKPLKVDFTAGKVAHRRQFGGGRGQLVAKACGLSGGITPSVVDATAGLGRDAFVLASLGAEVLMIERVPAIAALLEDGLTRARQHPETAEIAARMQLMPGDASQALATGRAAAKAGAAVTADPPARVRRAHLRTGRMRCGASSNASAEGCQVAARRRARRRAMRSNGPNARWKAPRRHCAATNWPRR